MRDNGVERAEDLAHGQPVIITARWIFILAGWVLVLWQPGAIPVWQLQLQILLLIAYTIGNFFLTVQWMRRSKGLPGVVEISSLVDLALVTILVLALGGYKSNLYVFYFPALVALSVTFPKSVTVTYTLLAMVAYALITLIDASASENRLTTTEAQNIMIRLILMAAVAFCGGLYRNLEADRRHGSGRLFQLFKSTGSAEAPRTSDSQPQH